MQSWLICIGMAAATYAGVIFAQVGYPTRPIRLVVPFPPGGTIDIQGRRLGDKLAQRLGQSVIVDNRGGANGIIAMDIVARAPADGYTIIISAVGPLAINPHLYRLPYDVFKDFAPVIRVATTPGLLVVHPSVPVKTVKELIALARQKPGELNYGSAGVGGFGHMSSELFAAMSKIKMTHVPYKGSAPALAELLSGRIQVLFNSAATTIPQIKAGGVRALATTGATRLDLLPDLPTIAESGLPSYENSSWSAIAAPARTPQWIIERLNRELAAILQMPDIQEAARAESATINGGTPQDFQKYLKSEVAKFAKLVNEARIKTDARN